MGQGELIQEIVPVRWRGNAEATLSFSAARPAGRRRSRAKAGGLRHGLLVWRPIAVRAVSAVRRGDTSHSAPLWWPASARRLLKRQPFETDDHFVKAPTLLPKFGNYLLNIHSLSFRSNRCYQDFP
jgi:hypothetical protein